MIHPVSLLKTISTTYHMYMKPGPCQRQSHSLHETGPHIHNLVHNVYFTCHITLGRYRAYSLLLPWMRIVPDWSGPFCRREDFRFIMNFTAIDDRCGVRGKGERTAAVRRAEAIPTCDSRCSQRWEGGSRTYTRACLEVPRNGTYLAENCSFLSRRIDNLTCSFDQIVSHRTSLDLFFLLLLSLCSDSICTSRFQEI